MSRRRREGYVKVLVATVAVALCSVVSAVFIDGECRGDGTFDPTSPSAMPTGFCTNNALPSWDHSLTSWAVLLALFATPALIALVFGLIAVRSDRPRMRVASVSVAFALVALIFLTVAGPLAGNGYKGAA